MASLKVPDYQYKEVAVYRSKDTGHKYIYQEGYYEDIFTGDKRLPISFQNGELERMY